MSATKEKNVKELSGFNRTPIKAIRNQSSDECHPDAKVKSFYPKNDESFKSISKLEENNSVNISRAHTILNDHLTQAGS